MAASPSPSGRNSPACVARERQLAAARTRAGELGVDVLQVHVADPIAMVAGEGHGVGAADGEVPRVEAPAARRWRRARARRPRRSRRACRRAGAARAEARARRRARELVEVSPSALPVAPSSSATRGDQAGSDDGGGHEDLGAAAARHRGARRRVGARLRRSERSCSTSGTNPPTRPQPVPVEQRAHLLGVARQVAERAELRGREPERRPSRRARARAGACRPQPGTSQTPHEMGAPASWRPCDGVRGGAVALERCSPWVQATSPGGGPSRCDFVGAL